MVADAELPLDQSGHPRAGPQRRFVTEPLRPLPQALLQALALGGVQSRLAASAAGFPQCFSSLVAILAHPTHHRRAGHVKALRDIGLVQSVIQQADSLKSALFQGVKIATNTGGIAHALLDTKPLEK